MKKKAGDHRPRTVLNMSELLSFNYAHGKTDTETNFVVTVAIGFTTVMCLSLHHAQAQDLYEEKRSHESLAEKRRKARVECTAARRGGGHYG